MNLIHSTSPSKVNVPNFFELSSLSGIKQLLLPSTSSFCFHYEPEVVSNERKRKRENDERTSLSQKRVHSLMTIPRINNFTVLPEEMKLYIFSFLDLNSLNCVSQVCKEFNKMINNENLWLERYIRLWKNHPEMDPYLQLKRMSWKRFYFIRRKTERFYFSFDRHWIPNDAQTFHSWGDQLYNEALNYASTNHYEKAEWLFLLAFQEYDSSLAIAPEPSWETLVVWGDALADFAATKSGPEKEFLFRFSQQKYEQAKNILRRDAIFSFSQS